MGEKKDDGMPDFSDVKSGASTTAAPGSSGAPAQAFKIYEVKPGDSLSKIAKHEYGSGNEWQRIFDANQDVLKDPNKIFPGQKLKIPPKS